MPKIKQSVTETVIDDQGKVKERRSNQTLDWGKEPPYVKMYLDTILYLKDLPKGYNAILLSFLKHMSYADSSEPQVIYINQAMKKKIAKDLDVSLSRINNAITDLVKGEVFERIDIGAYRVNANLFGKGEWQDIARLRLNITFDCNGKTIMGTVEKKSNQKDNKIPLEFPKTGTE